MSDEMVNMGEVSRKKGIAFVIPVYNEAKAIEKLLIEINEKILNIYDNIDVYVFEDGSTDGTKEVLKKFLELKTIPRLYVSMTPDRKGYPRAARDAILSVDSSKYAYTLFMDGDGQYYMEDVSKSISMLSRENPEYDIIIGMRTKRVEPIWRKALTNGLRILECIFFNPRIKDVTSALRLMKTDIAQSVTSEVKHSKYNFWLEFTARMSVHNLRVLEVPVDYMKREEGVSQVYNLRNIPKIVWAEFKAIARTWFELHWKKVSKFAFVGATGATIILFLTWLLTEYMGLWYMLSATVAIELSIFWAFALNTKITFGYQFISSVEVIKGMAKYHATALGGLVINLVALYILTEYTNIYYLISEFVAIIIAFGFNYLASIRYVWRISK